MTPTFLISAAIIGMFLLVGWLSAYSPRAEGETVEAYRVVARRRSIIGLTIGLLMGCLMSVIVTPMFVSLLPLN